MGRQTVLKLSGLCLAGMAAMHASASTITDVSLDASGNVTSVEIDATTTHAIGDLIAVSDVTSYAASNKSILVIEQVGAGTTAPAPGSRAEVIDGDANVYTGFTNTPTANDSVTLEFAAPIINQAGGDVILMEMGGTDTFSVRKLDTTSLSVSASGFAVVSASLRVVETDDASTPGDLATLETVGTTLGTNPTQTIHAVIFDLSDLGYADGAAVSSISFGGGGTADLVAAFGLPVPEPASLALMGLGAALLVCRNRKTM